MSKIVWRPSVTGLSRIVACMGTVWQVRTGPYNRPWLIRQTGPRAVT